MANIPVAYDWLTIVAAFRRSIDWARNGIAPSGAHMRMLADLFNLLVAGRPKQLFAKSVRPSEVVTAVADTATWRAAFHTSPCASSISAQYVIIPTSGATSAGGTSYCYLSLESGLTGVGSGTVTTGASAFMGEADSGTIVPDDYRQVSRKMAVNSDTDYRMTLRAVNGMRPMSLVVHENPRITVDPTTDTNAVDTAPFSGGAFVHDAPIADLMLCADKVWRRCGKHLFSWSIVGITAGGGGAVTRTSATPANLLDQSLTAWGADNPGFQAVVQYCGSLDSDNVGVMFYCFASMASGDASIEFRVSGSTIATITVDSSTAQFFTQAGNLNGANASDNIQVLLAGDGVNTLTVYAVGAFLYVA